MGIKHSENTGRGLVFVNVDSKAGVFTQGGNALDHGTSVEGILKKFSVRAESFTHNGQEIHKETLNLRFADTQTGDPDIVVCITMATGGDGKEIAGDASYTALRLLGKLNAADLSQPIEIKPWGVKAGQKFGDGVADKDMTGVAVKQAGQSLVEDYGDGVTKLPELQVVKANGKPVLVQGKEVKDKGPWNDLLDKMLTTLEAKLPAMSQAQSQAPAAEEIDTDAAAAAAQAAAQPAATESRQQFRARATA